MFRSINLVAIKEAVSFLQSSEHATDVAGQGRTELAFLSRFLQQQTRKQVGIVQAETKKGVSKARVINEDRVRVTSHTHLSFLFWCCR